MKAMIFAAGLGTRFKPWTDHHPKALAYINGKSLLQRNIEYLQQYGITDVVVNAHHFADQLIHAIEQHHGWGSHITISDERGTLLETGGGLLNAAPLLQGNEPFITLNADVLTNLNLQQLFAFHQQQAALITLAVSKRVTSRYFLFDGNNRLCGWRNVKTGEERIVVPGPHLTEKAYSTVAVFSPAVFDLIQQRGKFSLVETYLDLATRYPVMGYTHSGDSWVDVGKPESVPVAEQLFP